MTRKLFFILFIFAFYCGIAQENQSVNIDWKADFSELNEELQKVYRPYFTKAFYTSPSSVPYYKVSKKVFGEVSSASIKVENKRTAKVENKYLFEGLDKVVTTIKRVDNYSLIQFLIPTIARNEFGETNKLLSFDYSISYSKSVSSSLQKRSFRSGTNSQMAIGDWYKIGVTSTGIQKLTASFFSQNGISLSGVNPNNIRVFGYSEGMLNESINSFTPSTLPELPIYIEGENDGEFNNSDFILFFASQADNWEWNADEKYFFHQKHLYSDTTYYFINVGTTGGKRISNKTQTISSENRSFSTFENHQFYEVDNYNLIKTGRDWFGDYFDIAAGLKKNYAFSFPNKIDAAKVKFKSRIAVRSTQSSGNDFSYSNNGSLVHQRKGAAAVSSNYTSNYVTLVVDEDSFDNVGNNVAFEIEYGYPTSGSTAWLDYVEMKTECALDLSSGPLYFSQPKSVGEGNISKFEIKNTFENTRVWDVTNPYLAYELNTEFENSKTSFKIGTDSITRFVAFTNSGFKSPIYTGKINNQNLMALTDIDYVLITAPEFKSQAQSLASFHNSFSKLTTTVVTPQEIYNEFSNGHPDISGIRNFLKYLYDNASSNTTRLKYVLLFGDGNYDPKSRISKETYFIPSFQSSNSYSPTASFVSDDYFGMFDDALGIYNANSTVDIGIGRLPAKSSEEAQGIVDKIIHYANSVKKTAYDGLIGSDIKSTFNAWKNDVVFVADDGSLADNYTTSHLTQTETIVNALLSEDSSYNINKVYLDAYNKLSTSGGSRYPDVNREIRESMENGAFFASYIGHGGEGGWADERILEISDINAWTNINALPVFITATCEFSRYDDPERTSGGEYVILNPKGGAIAMITTTRLVYGGISNNIGFSINFLEAALNKYNDEMPTLGDAMRLTKVNSSLGTNYNNRKFALLGDPALKMAYPKYEVVTTKINGKEFSPASDTLKALSKIKIEGEIQYQGQSSDLNGFIYPTVYDKLRTVSTLDNNSIDKTVDFQSRSNIIYKGTSSVTNGKFSFEFIVPKDINYSFGFGRISYYFANDTVDGNGYTEEIVVGGSSDSAKLDTMDPIVELFMNDTNFNFGGVTNESPSIIAYVSDENGINTSGTSLGHDVSAILDEEFENPIILNDYYTAELNNYKKGKIIYPLNELNDGNHSLTLKVWDVNNNSGNAYTEFIVANDAKLAIEYVYNYPNPFTTETSFLFEHNKMNETLDVFIKIFTVSGKIIKTIETEITNTGNTKNTPIKWDGFDDYGDKIGRGVYVYRLEVRSPDGDMDQKIEKLVVLR